MLETNIIAHLAYPVLSPGSSVLGGQLWSFGELIRRQPGLKLVLFGGQLFQMEIINYIPHYPPTLSFLQFALHA